MWFHSQLAQKILNGIYYVLTDKKFKSYFHEIVTL